MSKRIRKVIETPVELHNEFTLVITEYETEACKKIKKAWEAKAYNVVLNQGLDKVVNGFDTNGSGSYPERMGTWASAIPGSDIAATSGWEVRIGGYIHYGSGDTTPAVTDTKLTTYEGSKWCDANDVTKGYDTSGSPKYGWLQQMITILPAEEVGTVFKEVGLASHESEGGASAYLSTHAIIVDSEGDPLSITKTSTMQIEIYSKFYLTLASISYANTDWVSGDIQGATENALLRWISDNRNIHSTSNIFYVYTGTNDDSVAFTDPAVKTELDEKTINKTTVTTGNYYAELDYRYETDESNGKIKEIGAALSVYFWNPVTSPYCSLFRSVMPVTGVYTGTTFTDVELGTGDGVEDEFTLGETDEQSQSWTWNEINETNPTVKVDGVTQTAGTDFTYNDTTGVITFESGSIPPSGDAVTASWTVPYIAKSNDYVLDIVWRLTFAEGTVPT